uniref:Uncharacterized protein n=1 Tax=Pseudomonas aeruginosa TaxID=287 RepID=A0A7S6K697_PSEAI|nr:hypothetical protein [Pseudomonas aeruginosa]
MATLGSCLEEGLCPLQMIRGICCPHHHHPEVVHRRNVACFGFGEKKIPGLLVFPFEHEYQAFADALIL